MEDSARGIDVLSFATARATEMVAVYKTLNSRSGARRVVRFIRDIDSLILQVPDSSPTHEAPSHEPQCQKTSSASPLARSQSLDRCTSLAFTL